MNYIDLKFVRRAGRRCFRAMDAYRKGLEGPLLDYALKTYSSHRRIPTEKKDLDKIRDDFDKKTKLKQEI